MKKLTGLSRNEVRDISKQIADAFYDYKYNEEDLGLVKYIKSKMCCFWVCVMMTDGRPKRQ